MTALKFSCARCGKRAKAETFSYSRWTNRRYCLDTKACERRVRKLLREGATFDHGFLESA